MSVTERVANGPGQIRVLAGLPAKTARLDSRLPARLDWLRDRTALQP